MDRHPMGYGTRPSYALKHRPRDVTGFSRIENHRYGLVLSNGGLVFMELVARMIRIYDAI
jgi:hypothetical protein